MQVGVVDDAAAPVTSAVVLPAVFGDDRVEVAAEFFQRGAVGNGLVHGGAEVRQQVEAVSAGDDKGVVVFGAVDVGIAFSRDVQLVAKETQLLVKRQFAVGDGHGALPSSCTSARPARWAAVEARASTAA